MVPMKKKAKGGIIQGIVQGAVTIPVGSARRDIDRHNRGCRFRSGSWHMVSMEEGLQSYKIVQPDNQSISPSPYKVFCTLY